MGGPLGVGYAVVSHSCARKQASKRVRTARLDLMSLGVKPTSRQHVHNILGVVYRMQDVSTFTVYQARPRCYRVQPYQK